jgi:hypothetical protein
MIKYLIHSVLVSIVSQLKLLLLSMFDVWHLLVLGSNMLTLYVGSIKSEAVESSLDVLVHLH